MADKSMDNILETIKKLLARSKNNPFESEAETCLLKAQKLMAEHNITLEDTEQGTIEYSIELCDSKWNMGFRKPLGHVIAENFRCEMFIDGRTGGIVFLGHSLDAKIAKEAFEYAYIFAMKEGNRLYNKAYAAGCRTKGVFNSYTLGFIQGLKARFDEQCTALAICVPPDVKQEFQKMTEGWKNAHGGMKMDGINRSAFDQGVRDGKTVLNGAQLNEG